MTDRLPEQLIGEQPAETKSLAETVETILEQAKEIEQMAPTETAPTEEPRPTEQPTRQPTSTLHKSVAPRTADDLTLSIEKIMEEDVGEAYTQLSPIAKQEFKLKGEQAARAIRTMMQSATLKVKKIFTLILHWLKMLPGINRFFLEQEAKIKTDRIIILHHERKEQSYAA